MKNLNNEDINNIIIIILSLILFTCAFKKEYFSTDNLKNIKEEPKYGKEGKMARQREHEIKKEEMAQSTKQAQKLPATIIGVTIGGMVLSCVSMVMVSIVAVKAGGSGAK